MATYVTYTLPITEKAFRDTARALKTLATEVDDDNVLQPIRRVLAEELLAELDNNIKRITDPDGNPVGYTRVREAWLKSWVSWVGDEVIFLEFGTGHKGAVSGYIGVYAPSYNPKDHTWSYKDRTTGQSIVTDGVPSYAPMYKVYLDAAKISEKPIFLAAVKRIIEDKIREVFGG